MSVLHKMIYSYWKGSPTSFISLRLPQVIHYPLCMHVIFYPSKKALESLLSPFKRFPHKDYSLGRETIRVILWQNRASWLHQVLGLYIQHYIKLRKEGRDGNRVDVIAVVLSSLGVTVGLDRKSPRWPSLAFQFFGNKLVFYTVWENMTYQQGEM